MYAEVATLRTKDGERGALIDKLLTNPAPAANSNDSNPVIKDPLLFHGAAEGKSTKDVQVEFMQ